MRTWASAATAWRPSAAGETDAIHHQRVALPVPDRVAVHGQGQNRSIRMLAAIKINVPGKGVDFRHKNDLTLRLDDIPRGRMLHKKRIRVGQTPPRSEGDDVSGLLLRLRPAVSLDHLRLKHSLWHFFERSA